MHGEAIRLVRTPLRVGTLSRLRAGDHVVLSGPIVLVRDAARADTADDWRRLPGVFAGQVLWLDRPARAASGESEQTVLGLLACGAAAVISTQPCSPAVRYALRKYGALALRASRRPRGRGTAGEALRTIYVRRLSLVVAVDAQGGELPPTPDERPVGAAAPTVSRLRSRTELEL